MAFWKWGTLRSGRFFSFSSRSPLVKALRALRGTRSSCTETVRPGSGRLSPTWVVGSSRSMMPGRELKKSSTVWRATSYPSSTTSTIY